MLEFWKAHAYGNDFLYVRAADVPAAPLASLARDMCDRHTGIGGDGLVVYEEAAGGCGMRLWNADGSVAEVSGNGVRGLGAVLLQDEERVARELTVQTAAGPRRLTRTGREGSRQTFQAAMGAPASLQGGVRIEAAGDALDAVVLDMGNPQCVLLGPLPDRERFGRLGAALERHPRFPNGTNVEFASVEAPDRVRILIWERGVGPTTSSGTGSCAALVAAAAFGGAAREADVVAPGGSQRVAWRSDGVYLTGWAEVICRGAWLRPLSPA